MKVKSFGISEMTDTIDRVLTQVHLQIMEVSKSNNNCGLVSKVFTQQNGFDMHMQLNLSLKEEGYQENKLSQSMLIANVQKFAYERRLDAQPLFSRGLQQLKIPWLIDKF